MQSYAPIRSGLASANFFWAASDLPAPTVCSAGANALWTAANATGDLLNNPFAQESVETPLIGIQKSGAADAALRLHPAATSPPKNAIASLDNGDAHSRRRG